MAVVRIHMIMIRMSRIIVIMIIVIIIIIFLIIKATTTPGHHCRHHLCWIIIILFRSSRSICLLLLVIVVVAVLVVLFRLIFLFDDTDPWTGMVRCATTPRNAFFGSSILLPHNIQKDGLPHRGVIM